MVVFKRVAKDLTLTEYKASDAHVNRYDNDVLWSQPGGQFQHTAAEFNAFIPCTPGDRRLKQRLKAVVMLHGPSVKA